MLRDLVLSAEKLAVGSESPFCLPQCVYGGCRYLEIPF